jgi:hypothetical protein
MAGSEVVTLQDAEIECGYALGKRIEHWMGQFVISVLNCDKPKIIIDPIGLM